VNGRYEKDETRPANNSAWSPHHSTGIHDPESFGIVQFSHKTFGTAEIVPDKSLPARSILMQIYNAQKKFNKENGRYAASLEELGLMPETREGMNAVRQFTMNPGGYIATVELSDENKTTRWHVNEISRLWKE
jgi:hypothetical protein